MVKEKRILSYFIGWLLIGFIIMFVGINKTFAATYEMNYQYEQKYYDNSGSSVNPITTSWNDSFNSYISGSITTVANSYGAGLAITSPIPLLGGHTYSMSVYFEEINNIALSKKNEISVASSLSSAANDYANNIPGTEMVYSKVSNNTILQFVFKVDNNHTHLFFPWTTTTTTTQDYVLTQIVMEDLGSSGITENEINQSLNSQTNEINNSIQNSTNTITDKINDMEQSIVDSNKETQDVIKDQLNDCRDSVNLLPIDSISSPYVSVNSNGTYNIISGTTTSSVYPIGLPIELQPGTYTFSSTELLQSGVQIYLWDSVNNKYDIMLSQYINKKTFTINETKIFKVMFYIPANTTLVNQTFGLQIEKGSNKTDWEEYGKEFCNNKIDETNDKLDGIQGALTDSSAPNTSDLENSAGWLPAGPLDSILNLPLTMLNSLTNSLNKTCSPLILTLPYVNKNIEIPCLSSIFNKITGVNGLWTWVGTIASVLILYNYLLNLYAWVDRVLTLRAEFDEAMGADMANWGRL